MRKYQKRLQNNKGSILSKSVHSKDTIRRFVLPKKIWKAEKGCDSWNEVQESEGQSAECLNEGPKVVEKLGTDFGPVAAEERGRDEGGKIGDPEDESILWRSSTCDVWNEYFWRNVTF